MQTNAISDTRIEEVKKLVSKDAGAINRGEKAAEHVSALALDFLAELMTAYGLARAEWQELTSDEQETVDKVIGPALSRVLSAKEGKAQSVLKQLASRCKAMAHRGVTPKLTRLTVPVVTVKVEKGKTPKATDGTTTITVDTISDWNQDKTATDGTTKDGNYSQTVTAGASKAFNANEAGAPKVYRQDVKRAKEMLAANIKRRHPTVAGLGRAGNVDPADLPSLGAVLGGYLGHQGAANTINALAEAFKATPTGKHRETAMNILRKAQASLEALAHQQAEHISKAS